MNRKLHFPWFAATFVAAALCATRPASAESPIYAVRPNCNSCNSCTILPGTYGYNDTWWRQWPTQYRPAVSDPRGIGSTMIPPPPSVPEALPPVSPSQRQTPGGTSAPVLPGGPSTSNSGSISTPGGVGPVAPGPEVFPGLPGTIVPLTEPKPGDEGGKPVLPAPKELTPKDAGRTEPSPSGAGGPGAAMPLPSLTEPPLTEPAKTPGRESPSTNLPKADAPPLGEPAPVKPAGSGATLPRRHGAPATDFAKPRSDAEEGWTSRSAQSRKDGPGGRSDDAEVPATSSRPSADSDRSLRRTSFEQRSPKAMAAMPIALDGYCPVELKENEKWVAGRSEFQTSYLGQVFQFSSAAAMKQFITAPEKYAPALGGNDAVLAMEEDRVAPGSIQHSAMWRGRLYLFTTAANVATFREDPARYANRSRLGEEQRLAHAAIDKPAPPSAAQQAEVSRQPQQLQLPGDSL